MHLYGQGISVTPPVEKLENNILRIKKKMLREYLYFLNLQQLPPDKGVQDFITKIPEIS